MQPGSRARVTYLRDGKRRTTRLTVEAAPDVDSETIDADSDGADEAKLEVFDGAEITNIPEDLELRGGEDGDYVSSVQRGSRAYRAGLRRGDIIRRVGKTDIATLSEFENAIEDGAGPYALRVERQGQNLYLAVK